MEVILSALCRFVVALFLCFIPASTLYSGIKMAMRGENAFLVTLMFASAFVTFFIIQFLLQGIVFGEDKK